MRDLVLVLGDQLDLAASAFDGFDAAQDAVWMAEVAGESTHVWSSQPRIALFLAGMRHFAEALVEAGRPLHYRRLDDTGTRPSLAEQLATDIARLQPQRLVLTQPGDWRVRGCRWTCAATATSSRRRPSSPRMPNRAAAAACAWSSSTASSAPASGC